MKSLQIKLGAILSYISMALKIIISLIYTPIMLRFLGQNEYGLYQLSASIVSNLSILSLGFGSSYVRFYAQSVDDEMGKKVANLNGMYLLINGVLATIVLVVGFFLVSQSRMVFGSELSESELSRASELLFILVINLALSFINMIFNSYITANQNFIFQRLLEIIQALASPFVQLPLLILGYGSLGVVIGTTVTSIIIYLINIYYSFRKLSMKISFNNMDMGLFKEIGQYSSYIFLAMIIDQINWSVDVYLVGRLKGTVATAVYSIAELIDGYFRNFSSALSTVLVPTIHLLIAQGTDDLSLSKFFSKTGRVQFVVMALFGTGFIFFGRPFIYYWAGEDYLEAYLIAIVLIVPLMFISTQNLGIEIRRAKNMQRFYTLVSFFTAILNVVLTAILLNFFPPISAAFSTSITLLINAIILNWDYRRNVGLDIRLFWKSISLLSLSLIIPIISGVIIVSFVDLYNIVNLGICIVIYSVIYALSFWVIGLNSEEKALIFRRNG